MGDSGATRNKDDAAPAAFLRRGGLSEKAATGWLKSQPRFGGKFNRDAAAGAKFWRTGSELLAKLPKKNARAIEQQIAANVILQHTRETRQAFLSHHADAIYRKLTKNLGKFLRVDELAYDAAKLVPGLTPTRMQVDAEGALKQSEKDGAEVDQGLFLAHVFAKEQTGMHMCHAMLRPRPEAIERSAEFIARGKIDFGPAKVERQGKAAVVTVKNPRFLNAEDDDTLDATETAVDIAI